MLKCLNNPEIHQNLLRQASLPPPLSLSVWGLNGVRFDKILNLLSLDSVLIDHRGLVWRRC